MFASDETLATFTQDNPNWMSRGQRTTISDHACMCARRQAGRRYAKHGMSILNESGRETSFHSIIGNPQSDFDDHLLRKIARSNASDRGPKPVKKSAANLKVQKTHEDGELEHSLKTVPNLDRFTKNALPLTQASQRRCSNDENAFNPGGRYCNRPSNNLLHPINSMNIAEYFFGILPISRVSRRSIARTLQDTASSYAQLFPPGSDTAVSRIAKIFFQQCLMTSGSLHTALYCQAMRAQVVHPGSTPLSKRELLLCQTEAIHAVNRKMLRSATAPDDESLRIVFSLTWHGAVNQDPQLTSPRQVQLTGLQALGLWLGAVTCDSIHARGLKTILTLRGGLDKIEMPGLAFLVSYGDIITASSRLTRPEWPYDSYARHDPGAMVNDEWLSSISRASHPLISLGNGFSALYLWMPSKRASELEDVFLGMANYTRASDDLIRSHSKCRNRAVMTDQRNAIQHRLLSLCLLNDDKSPERDIFELCWLAGVAYSMIGVFPLSPSAARFDRLAHRIKQAIVGVAGRRIQAPGLGIWITVIGALCAIGTPDRDWYVEVLEQGIDGLGIPSWYDLRLMLMDFLWFPLVSDLDGQELWAEIEQGCIVKRQHNEQPANFKNITQPAINSHG